MRKLLFTFSVFLLMAIVAKAQAPAFFNYQGVARNSVGNALVNKSITLRLTIHDGSALGAITYRETRNVTTNAFGLFSVQVGGAGATNVSGSIAGTNWNIGTKWIQVELDPEGGNTLKDVGTTQLTAVPYALFTSQAGDVVLPFVKSQNEESPLFKVTNTGNNANSLAFEGFSNSTATNATAMRGIIASPSPGGFSAGVVGQNNGTSGNGIGVYGTQNGTGWGVYGTTPGGVGVYGNSTSGMGVYAQSVTGISLMGYQPANGTNNAGFFQNFNQNNTAAALRVLTNGQGEGFGVNVTGTGKAALLTVNNAVNSANALEVSTNGVGRVAMLQNTNPLNNANVVDATTNGVGRAGQFQNTNAASTAPTVSVFSNGAGDNFQSVISGTGKAGLFNINNPANSNNVVDVTTIGLGRAGFFQNSNAGNAANIVEVTSNGTGKVGVVTSTNPASTANVLDVSTNGLGRTGSFQNTNAANAANVVEVSTNGTGRAGLFQNTNAANTAANISSLSNGAGDGIQSIVTGAGKAGVFTVNNAASVADALSAVTNGTGTSWAIRGTSTGTQGAGLFIQSNAANTANNLQSNQAGLGRAALFNASNAANAANALEVTQAGTGRVALLNATNGANTSNALEVTTAGTGFAANFISTNASPKALHTAGAIQLTGIGEGVNKILMTDLAGNANWNSLASVGGVSGTGTLNYIAKWTPNGTFVGNSIVFDDGTNVGVGMNTPGSKLTVAGDFTAKTSTSGYVGTFENTNATDGDGLKIKLGKVHPAWTGSAYKQIDLATLIAPFQPQIDIVKGWVESGHAVTAGDIIDLVKSNAALLAGSLCQLTDFLTDQLNDKLGLPFNIAAPVNTALGLPLNLSTPINNALGLPFDIGANINSGIGLPVRFSILDIINQACDVCVDDDDVADSYFDLVPAFPVNVLKIPAIPSTFTIPAIPTLTIPAIPHVSSLCAGLPTLSLPNIDFNSVSNSLTKNNNFITFADMGDRQVGAIRAQSVAEWKTSYLSPTFFLGLVGSMAGLDLSGAAGKAAGAVVSMVSAYNKIGIEYVSGNGDYAEWLPRINPDENISEGDIVGVKGGKITKDIDGAEQVMAVSHKPIVLGNIPEKGKETMGNNIAFMGQIPVKIMGPVRAGDYIVAKGEFAGMGVAIHPEAMSVEDFKKIVGRSWDTDEKNGPKMVNTVVGLHNNDFLKFVADLQQKAQTTDERLKLIESKLNIQTTNSNPTTTPAKKGFK